ncbi:MAG: hypothetical protein JSR99_06345 [Proteobacteria bacterium]|nr:hypothetical protein [Pseudomonadota bacterium]
MTYLLLQTFLLLLASYFLGAFVACVVKRALFSGDADALVPIEADIPIRPPVVMPPQTVRPRMSSPIAQPVAPRAIDPVQPKIEVLRRPEPRAVPAVLDPSRFERALHGPNPNEGIPRIAIVELRPSVLKPVTGIYRPRPPEPPPAPPVIEESLPEETVPEEIQERETAVETEAPAPRPGGLAARLRDATTAAAAGAVAAAKAAAAASAAIPVMVSSRRAAVDEQIEEKPTPEPEEPTHVSGEDVSEIVGETVEAPSIEPVDDSQGAETEPIDDMPAKPEAEVDVEPEAAPEPASAPKPEPPVVAPAAIEGGDDFQRIRAIDGDIEQKLKARGVTYFEHIAAWNTSDIKRIGQELEIPGRIDREQWVEQAQILAKGGETYYSRNRRAMLNAASPAPPSANIAGAVLQPREDGPVSSSSVPSENVQRKESLSGVAAANQGRSVAEMAAAAAAAIAAASASVTRGLKPIEPISPLSKVDPKISIPARITDAIREKETTTVSVSIAKETAPPEAGGDGPADDLKRIRGIGVLIEKRLNAIGVRRYEQIANWTSGDIDRVSRLLEFKGRIERESWVEQARILASGGQTEFSRRVDRGEVDTSRET